MLIRRSDMLCGMKLRTLCLAIGVIHLVSSFTEILSHIVTVGYVTRGFQCDPNIEDIETLSKLDVVQTLNLLTLGTHGFYQFPRIISPQYNTYLEYMSVVSRPQCYPGMLHMYIIDILKLTVNLIWLRFVVGYIRGVLKNDQSAIGMFVRLFIVKLVMQILYIGYYPPQYDGVMDGQMFCLLKFLDIVISFYLLMVVKRHSAILKLESQNQVEETADQPPPYVECLIVGKPVACEKVAVVEVNKEKKEVEAPKTV